MIHVSNDGYPLDCPCGNHIMASGFDTCDQNGKYVEPCEKIWVGLYACLECGSIIDKGTYEVISKTNDLSSFNVLPT